MKTTRAFILLLSLACVSGPAFLSAAEAGTDNDGDGVSAVEDREQFNKFSIGLHGGVLSGFTDVQDDGFIPGSDEITFGGGLMLNYHMSPVLTLQGSFLYGELKGFEDNLEYEAELLEAALRARISFNTLFVPMSRANQYVNFYGFVGAGAFAYRSKLFDTDENEYTGWFGYEMDGTELATDDYEIEMAVPFGLGVNFRLSPRLDIGIETGFRYTSTDRLDARPIHGSRADMYNYTTVGITFRLGRNTNSMDWAPTYQAMYPGDVSRIERLAERTRSVEEEVAALGDAHGADLDELRSEMEKLAREQGNLATRTAQVFRAIDDITQQVLMLEDRLEGLLREPDTFYSVQVMALKEELGPDKARKYLRLRDELEVYHINGWYKYISGRHDNLEDALLHMQRIWGQGVRDAFVVKYEDGMLRPR